jgi:hypothetical protein
MRRSPVLDDTTSVLYGERSTETRFAGNRLPGLTEVPLGTASLLLLPTWCKGTASTAGLLLPTGMQQYQTWQLGPLVRLVHDQRAAQLPTVQQHAIRSQLPQRGGLFHILAVVSHMACRAD